VEEFLVRIDAAIREADKEERAALRSLRGGAEDLRNESIGSAVRRLAAPIAITWPGWDGSTTQLVTKSYSARSDLVHGGETTHDLSQLGGALKLLVRNLCLQQPREAFTAAPPGGTSRHDRSRRGVRILLAKLRSALWSDREMLAPDAMKVSPYGWLTCTNARRIYRLWGSAIFAPMRSRARNWVTPCNECSSAQARV
jgi:hypothetical protein